MQNYKIEQRYAKILSPGSVVRRDKKIENRRVREIRTLFVNLLHFGSEVVLCLKEEIKDMPQIIGVIVGKLREIYVGAAVD